MILSSIKVGLSIMQKVHYVTLTVGLGLGLGLGLAVFIQHAIISFFLRMQSNGNLVAAKYQCNSRDLSDLFLHLVGNV